MVIGLYDIDLWHGIKKYPNLELMKVYNYCYQNSQKVLMMQPSMDEGRFDKIFYFKEAPYTRIPKSLVLTGEKKTIYGYGFYKHFIPLSEKYKNISPSFLPYDSYSNKMSNKQSYERMRRSSIVRLENSDFSGFSPETKCCYIVDWDCVEKENLIPFIEEHQMKFNFFRGLKIKTAEQFQALYKYQKKIENSFAIDFKFSLNFFIENLHNQNVIYEHLRRNDNLDDYFRRLIILCLLSKQEGVSLQAYLNEEKEPLAEKILKWGWDKKSDVSFYKYYGEVPSDVSSDIRLLLKQNPKTFKSQSLDFWN